MTGPVEFADPHPRPVASKPTVTAEAQVIANEVRDSLWWYSSQGRSAQVEIGASELGHPCDRRLALKMAGSPVFNARDLGWAAVVGTSVHAWVAEAFIKKGAATGRYLVEHRITEPVRGTLDLFDRLTGTVYDWKIPGDWSMKQVRQNGPGVQYVGQGQTYGYGLALQGEKVKRIAIVFLPKNSTDLKDMYVHVERYDPNVARKLIARADGIRGRISHGGGEVAQALRPEPVNPLSVPATPDHCNWCPYSGTQTGACDGT